MKNPIRLLVLLCALALMSGFMSCTKYDTPASVAIDVLDSDSTDTEVVRKVLWVNIDGAVGSIVQQLTLEGTLPSLQTMLKHSKYTWLGQSDAREIIDEDDASSTAAIALSSGEGEDPLTWTSMLTGINSRLHNVKDESYTPDFPLDDNPVEQEVNYFPTVIEYLTDANATLQISCVTPWPNLNRYLGSANLVTTTESDEETLATLLSQLAEDDYDFIITSFKGALTSGVDGGFSIDNTTYTSALQAIDGYIGQLLSAIEVRESADYEDWLVIVSSNHGGTVDGGVGGTTDEDRDIFGLFYYSHYTEYEMQGEILEATLFDGDLLASVLDTMANYGLSNASLSLDFNLRMLPKEDGSYTGNNWDRILGKSGWGISRQRSTVVLRANADTNIEQSVTGANDSKWHSFYFGFGTVSDGSRQFYCAYDGTRLKSALTTGGVSGLDADSTYLYIGAGNLPTSYYVSSLRVYNTILDDAYVDANASRWDEIPASDASYSSLIGEWVLTSEHLEQDSIIVNTVAGMPDLHFNMKPTIDRLANTLPDKVKNGDLVMENTLIAPQIIYWLCDESAIDSVLEGYNFLSLYSTEEQWRDYE